MLISDQVLKRLLPRKRAHLEVLHVGAHIAEESGLYRSLGLGRVTWVEANPELAKKIPTLDIGQNDRVYCGAAWSESGVSKVFNITDNLQSSSLLNLSKHKFYYPDIQVSEELAVKTVRLDELIPKTDYFMMNLDIQGAELEALRGCGHHMENVKIIYTEVNREHLYENCPLVQEIDEWLKPDGFKRIVTAWTTDGWGDAIYVRRMFFLRILIALSAFKKSQRDRATPSAVFRRRVMDPTYLILRKLVQKP